MYQTVIDIKNSDQGDTLRKLQLLVENAFSNRAGKVANVSNEPHRFVFEGGENDYGLPGGWHAYLKENRIIFRVC
ncbi:MAG TPA: hypothetical protein GXX75_20650 [Clostridiales bacterium]|nr:hypothetical protein [Clostridiales bacterium]